MKTSSDAIPWLKIQDETHGIDRKNCTCEVNILQNRTETKHLFFFYEGLSMPKMCSKMKREIADKNHQLD